jgi:hypothetical protein
MIDRRGAYCAICFGTLLSLFETLPAAALPAVEAFGSLPTVSSAELSPDGKNLAIIDTINGHPGVAVFSLVDPNAKIRAAAFPDAAADWIMWANSNRLICAFRTNQKMKFYSKGIQVMTRAISVAMDGGNAAVLLHDMPFFSGLFLELRNRRYGFHGPELCLHGFLRGRLSRPIPRECEHR